MTDIQNVSPLDTWESLKTVKDAILVDVRTQPEWAFTGFPDLRDLNKEVLRIEWKQYPAMNTNEAFAAQLLESLDGSAPSKIYFLCRTGVRSFAAAAHMAPVFAAQGQSVECINVAEGFEGDHDSLGHRGVTNGWKARGLAWHQP